VKEACGMPNFFVFWLVVVVGAFCCALLLFLFGFLGWVLFFGLFAWSVLVVLVVTS